MHAITIREPGGPEVLEWSQVPDPVPGPDEVLVDVEATAVNRADLLQRQGLYAPPEGASTILGLECSGRIVEVGRAVTGWSPGDAVCALLSGGGYAERVAVPADHLLPVPNGVSLPEAAALPEAACTVWSTVFGAARLSPGEVLLVHGGASGIGTFALQLASAYGARVFCTASAGKHDRLRAYGAERAIDYRTEDFVEVVRTAAGGADVVLDIMGGSYVERNIAALATDGRIVVIGMQGGRKAELDLGSLMSKRGTIHAAALRARSTVDKARIVRDVVDNVWPLVGSGRVRPVVDRVMALQDAAGAHRVLEEGGNIGKVLLVR
jgi:putative PIG3 family NAD(P)H quinone oxidoreductase